MPWRIANASGSGLAGSVNGQALSTNAVVIRGWGTAPKPNAVRNSLILFM